MAKENEKTNTGEIKPKFQQAEPAELDESALAGVAGGMLHDTKYTYCGGDGCYKPNPY